MKKCLKIFLTLGLFSFLIPTALAQESKEQKKTNNTIAISKTVHCGPVAEVLSSLSEQYEEEPFIMGGEPALMQNGEVGLLPTMLYINPTTQTYTVLQAPVLGVGTESPMEGKLCVLTAGKFGGVNKKMAAKLLNLGEEEGDSNTPQTSPSPSYEYHPDIHQALYKIKR